MSEEQPLGEHELDKLTVGEQLRQQRNKLGIDLTEVALETRIMLHYLMAIEDDAYEKLPTVAYAAGFIRSYARFLKMPDDALVKQFKTQVQENEALYAQQPTSYEAVLEENRTPRKRTIFIACAIAILLPIAWIAKNNIGRDSSEDPANSESATSEYSEAAPLNGSTKSLTNAESKTSNPAPSDPAKSTYPPIAIQDTGANGRAAALAQQDKREGEGATALLHRTKKAAGDRALAKDTIRLFALEKSWVRIQRSDNRAIIFEKLLKKGESYSLKQVDTLLLLSTGNAGGLEISLNGRRLPPLGELGKVVRKYSLSQKNLAEPLQQ